MKTVLILASLALPASATEIDLARDVEMASKHACELIASKQAGDVRVCIYKCDGQVTNVTIPATTTSGRINSCPKF